MTIDTYIIGWNEIDIIGLTIKHYQQFSNVTLFDNFSDDGTPDLARHLGATVMTFGRKGELNDAEYLKIKNRAWKKSKADFVIIVDADEILERPTETDCTIFKTRGFNIYSHDVPRESFSEILTGIPDDNYSKSVIFSPKHITDINYAYGAHSCAPKGDVRYSNETLTLFHYRAIGGPDRMVKRHAQYRKRLGYLNKQLNLGSHYNHPDERRIKDWFDAYFKCSPYEKD